MTKRLGHWESYKVKQMIFLLVLALVIVIIGAVLLYKDIIGNFAFLGIVGIILVLLLALVSRYDFLLTLKEYERAVIFLFGRFSRVGGPGWTLVWPVIQSSKIVDLRTQTIDVKPQGVITKDKVLVEIDAIIYLFVKKDPESVKRSVIEIDDYKIAAEQFVIANIRDSAGELTLTELISDIVKLNQDVKIKLEQITQSWGVSVEAVEIKHLTVPKQISDAFSEQKAAEQKKLARMEGAKAQEAEIDAVREAAEHLSDKALAYYYVQALSKLGESPSTKYIFPLELSNLAKAVSGGVHGGELEGLMHKYAPALKRIVRGPAPRRKARKRKRKR
ncbi:MAG: SPFH domain-containing protein [Candidatus Diapherotrites archaeon]